MILKHYLLLILTLFSTTNAQNSSALICNAYRNKCYRWTNKTATFPEAEHQCVNWGGHLTSIHNDEENYFVASIAQIIYKETGIPLYWIGGYVSINKTTSWTDGTLFNYPRWAPDEPKQDFVSINAWYTYFDTNPSYHKFPFICSVPTPTTLSCTTTSTQIPTTPALTTITDKKCTTSCDLGWTYNHLTDSCYKVFTNANFLAAETTCIANGAHLTSIHSEQENKFVNDLASSGIKQGCQQDLVWIGMKQVGKDWIWTDGSKADYFNWAPKQPDNLNKELCVQTAPDTILNKWNQEWNNCACTLEMRAFVCKKPSYQY